LLIVRVDAPSTVVEPGTGFGLNTVVTPEGTPLVKLIVRGDEHDPEFPLKLRVIG
jgi:hypothetical protein